MSGKYSHILLCDDDDDDLFFFKDVLNEVDDELTVNTVNNCDELIEALNHNNTKPDLLFLDVNMPGKSGIDCLRLIRDCERLNDLPIVIYSTSANKKDIDETFRLGANLYVQKASNFITLKNTIERLLTKGKGYLLGTQKDHFFIQSNKY